MMLVCQPGPSPQSRHAIPRSSRSWPSSRRSPPPPTPPSSSKTNDRVVLLGGAFIERLQTHGYLETALTAGLPDKNLTFRNLGWSGDTVWGDSRGVFGNRADGFKRLIGDVNIAKPTLLVICYGENEAYAGEAGLADFRGGLNALLDALKPTNARVLLARAAEAREARPAAARSGRLQRQSAKVHAK